MDYHKTEQKHYVDSTGNKLLYEPTGLADVIDIFAPISYVPLGAALKMLFVLLKRII